MNFLQSLCFMDGNISLASLYCSRISAYSQSSSGLCNMRDRFKTVNIYLIVWRGGKSCSTSLINVHVYWYIVDSSMKTGSLEDYPAVINTGTQRSWPVDSTEEQSCSPDEKAMANEQMEVLNLHDLSACQEQLFWCTARWTNAELLLACEGGGK